MCESLGAALFFASLLFILLGIGFVIIKITILACDIVGYCTIRIWRHITQNRYLK